MRVFCVPKVKLKINLNCPWMGSDRYQFHQVIPHNLHILIVHEFELCPLANKVMASVCAFDCLPIRPFAFRSAFFRFTKPNVARAYFYRSSHSDFDGDDDKSNKVIVKETAQQ